MTALDYFLWVALPYLAIAVFVTGTIWRYRYDKFGWTTRSSQIYGGRIIRLASPLFHFGALAAVGGHVVGLIVPEHWTDAVGITEEMYHIVAVSLGGVAGVAVIVGLALLIYRRRTFGPVFTATTKNDKLMYVILGAAILLGMTTTLAGSGLFSDPYNYRADVSEWFRSILLFNPEPELMASAKTSYQVHAVAGMLVFIIWPFTRLIHAFSVPVLYLFRPYVVYRSRGAHDAGSRKPRRGWERIGS